MADIKCDDFAQLPDEMLSFTLAHLEASTSAPRLGRLLLAGRNSIHTPHYVPTTSRGVIPHLTHDIVRTHTAINEAYFALEDFIEKPLKDVPIFKTPAATKESPLRKYTGLHDDTVSILGPRRVPALPCPAHNSNSAISVSTSVGFRNLENKDYTTALQILQPDIAIGLADITSTEKRSAKRIQKSADRTHAWLRDTLQALEVESRPKPSVFASILPTEKEQQSFYLYDLVHEFGSQISGLAIYEPSSVDSIPQDLLTLPRLCLSEPHSPQAILTAISLGVDIITTPFVTTASEHGIAFTFSFPGSGESRNPLGYDLWSAAYVTDLSPLSTKCDCYTCKRHHRAYVHHLLHAKEMLAWTLLQIHNHATMDSFFSDIRRSIELGHFNDDIDRFSRCHDIELPEKTGEGPRIRGYQTKSIGGGEAKKNSKAYGRLDDAIQKMAEAETGIVAPTGNGDELQEHGFAKKIDSQ